MLLIVSVLIIPDSDSDSNRPSKSSGGSNNTNHRTDNSDRPNNY